jgi:hypothetical protein
MCDSSLVLSSPLLVDFSRRIGSCESLAGSLYELTVRFKVALVICLGFSESVTFTVIG